MIDFTGFIEYLEVRKNKKYFIFQDEIISVYEIENIRKLLKEYNTIEVTNCIEPLKEGQLISKFTIELECEQCHSILISEMPKTTLIDYLKKDKKKGRQYWKYICKNCEENEKIKQQQKQKEYEKQKEYNTIQFIDKYLDINNHWKKEFKFYERWNGIAHSFVNWNYIAEYIRKMDYNVFLETPYWKIIAEKKKRDAGFRCQLCNSDKNLSTHHRTYEIRGKELQNLKELIVICDDCHKKHHNIKY